MSKYENRGFLLKQRAFLKLYMYQIIMEQKRYGQEYLHKLRKEFEPFGYSPTHSEMYKVLHELTREKLVTREKRIKGEPGVDFQEVIFYELTDKGKEEYDLFKKQMKVELERNKALLEKALRDHYAPLK
ncbi:helix-turn-helix transcriptional regulator [Priestia sp. YIM B13551]|uniref:helix-turn-helix transcriptional regulator n=1 Tax=Priestia sp. YIM B13551 TaxID=3366306 RepID=UPI00366ECC0C